MKLATFLLAGLLGATSIASADDLPAPADDGGDYYAPDAPPAPPAQPAPPARGPRRGGPRNPRNAAIRQMLLERFDANGDGRLEPRERRRAARALRRMAKRLGQQRGDRRQRLIQKYDLDGDGNLGPGELPPRVQQKLRRYDRNRDGWVDQNDGRL